MKWREASCIENRWAHMCINSSRLGRSSQDFVHRIIRAHILTCYCIISHSILTWALQAMHIAPDMTDLWYTKQVLQRNSLAHCLFCGSKQQHSLTLRKFIYLVISKSFKSVDGFHPILTCISMETRLRCRARWWKAAAQHNILVLIGQITCQSSSLRTVNWVLI